MSRHKLKEYRRPYMVVETFVPNEFVAACVKKYLTWVQGQFGLDLNGNGHYDAYEDRETGPKYVGGSYPVNQILNGKFEILNSGRYYNDEVKAYFYVGPGELDTRVIEGQTDLTSDYYNYSKYNFTPLYYAYIDVEGIPEPFNIYFKEENWGSGVTNAS